MEGGTVCTARRRTPVTVGRTTIKFLSHPNGARPGAQTQLSRANAEVPWTTEVSRGGRALMVTTPERTVVDGFATLNPDSLKEILLAYANRRLWAAVGWYLQRRLRDIFLDASILADFQRRGPRSRVYLVPGLRGGVLAKDWNLVVPAHLQRGVGGDEEGNGEDGP